MDSSLTQYLQLAIGMALEVASPFILNQIRNNIDPKQKIMKKMNIFNKTIMEIG